MKGRLINIFSENLTKTDVCSENMNKMYGFEGEVKAKYSANMCDLFTEVYNWLPLCHLLNHKVTVFDICWDSSL